MKRTRVLLFLLLALSFVLSACGSSSGTTLNVTVNEFSYSPSAFTVPAGQPVKLVVKNSGAVEHEFVIMKKDMTVTPPFGDKDEGNIYWEMDQIAAGTTKTDTFTAPSEPGQYEIVCGLAGHIESGMTATLTVK